VAPPPSRDPAGAPAIPPRPAPARGWWLPWLVLAALAVRLWLRVSAAASDLPYSDQWDLWRPLWVDGPWWSWFRVQHGPHWQGLGGLVLWASGTLSGFSTRAETLVSATLVVAGAATFLAFVRRVRGRLGPLDAAVPLLLLNGNLADALTEAPNPAHGPVPFLLLCAAPLAISARRAAVRLPATVALVGAAATTGFAVLAVPLLLALLAADAWRAPAGERGGHALALAGALALAATFFVGFVPVSAVDCFAFPDPNPGRYLPFSGLLLARPFGVAGPSPRGFLVAAVAGPAVLACALWGARRTLAAGRDALGRAAFVVCGFALAFAALTAIGRVCLGLEVAVAVRYVPYVLPALATTFVAAAARPPLGARWLAPAMALLVVASEARLTARWSPGPLPERKARFLACVRAGGTAASCTDETGLALHPRPATVEPKLRFLRERRLGPFRD
jgi:hypothetical protein